MAGAALRIAALLSCALLLCGAQARERPDRTDNPDIVQGDWIQPADVLLIGDSESLGYFGAQLYRSISNERDPRTGKLLTVWSFWTCGSDVTSWMRGGTSYCGIRTCNGAGDCARDHGPNELPGRVRYSALRDYIARIHPRVTIVALGSNMLSTRGRSFRGFYPVYLAQIGRLIDDMTEGHSRCIWIGPPQISLATKSIAEYEQFAADVGRAARAKGCAFVDSSPLSDRRYVLRGDSEGIHYQGAGERAWETAVWGVLRPILKALLSR